MNKIILVTLILTLFGCSTEQIKNASNSYSSPTESSVVRQHATLSVNIQDEKNLKILYYLALVVTSNKE